MRTTYEKPNSEEARRLRRIAAVAYGLSSGSSSRATGYMAVAHAAQGILIGERCDLGPTPIGFENLTILARATDANSGRVYLDGFDENLTVFAVYRRYALPGTVAIDVGANIGIHSLVLAHCVVPGPVYAYEPSQTMCERFRGNMTLNGIGNTVLRPVGAGERDGLAPFDPRESEFNIGLGRFHPNGSAPTPIVTLDADLRNVGKISLVKVDVEGMELAVLRGAKAILREHRPVVVVEYNTTWTLDDLRQALPYPIRLTSIPANMRDRPRDLTRARRCPESTNILAEPTAQVSSR